MNLRSMKGKVDLFELFLTSLKDSFDSLILTETWLTVNDQLLTILGYKGTGMIRNIKRGCRIAICVNNAS